MLQALLTVILANSPFVVPPPPGVSTTGYEANGACATQVTGNVVCYDNNGAAGGQLTSTTDPDGLMIRPQACSPSDGTCAAGSVLLCGGQDTTIATIDGADPTVTCADDNDTVTVTVVTNAGTSTATVLTEGTDWTASASVATTCASLATAVDALAGVSASCTSPDVRIQLDTTTCAVTLAESTAGCTTVATGTRGAVRFYNRITGQGDTDLDDGLVDLGNDSLALYVNGGLAMYSAAGTALSVGSTGITTLSLGPSGNYTLASGAWSNAAAAYTITDDIQQTGMIGQAAATITVGASATTFVATRNVNTIDCDGGGNTIATITRTSGVSGAGWLIMKFVDASCTITDTADGAADTVDLSAAFTSADDVVMMIVHDGTSWHELYRQTGL